VPPNAVGRAVTGDGFGIRATAFRVGTRNRRRRDAVFAREPTTNPS
jgi:hypothetical protein